MYKSLLRRYKEFLVLDSKLKQFYGEFFCFNVMEKSGTVSMYLRYSLKATSHSFARLSHEYTRTCYLPFRVIKPAAQKSLHTRFKVFIKVYYFTKIRHYKALYHTSNSPSPPLAFV